MALRPDPINIISLCSGGGGLDLGVELAIEAARIVCMVEREAFLVQHLVTAMEKRLLAQAPIWSDARTFDGRAWRGAVDGVIGGIPCQPHSLAGKRLGKEDERDLWSDARRIIVQSGAWFVLIENVRGMLSSGGADRVRRDLHRLGFQVEGGLFTAEEVGASHERERIFILAVADRVFQFSQRGRSEGISREVSPDEGKTPIRKRRGTYSRDRSKVLANTDSKRLEGQWPDHGTERRPDARGSAGLRDRAAVVDADGIRRIKGRPEPELRSRRNSFNGPNPPVDDPTRATGGVYQGQRQSGQAETDDGGAGNQLFPPGPGDLAGWRGVLDRSPELEPAFRRVADGMAAGMDVAQSWARVDRLRMLGNGVVSLEAAYALRTLGTRLAAGGSSGADFLVRAMRLVTGKGASA